MSAPQMFRVLRWKEAAAYAVVALLALLGGMLSAARVDHIGPLAAPEFRLLTTLPLAVYPVAILGAATVVLAARIWWVGLAVFFGWLPFEDLVRKFAANDLRVYFVKDVLLLAALVGLAPLLKGCWRRTMGELLLPTAGVIAIGVVYALPTAVANPSIPLIGLHQKFAFILLLPVGAFIAQDRRRLATAMFWLAILGALICAIGLLQAVLGATFLNPQTPAALLEHLTVLKKAGSQFVLRPSGTFADVSRFASMTIVSVVLGFSAYQLNDSVRRQRLVAAATIVSLAGAFASGSRTSLLLCAPLVLYNLFRARSKQLRRSTIRVVAVVTSIVLAGAFVGGQFGAVSGRTADFYESTLNPRSQQFEAGRRIRSYWSDAVRGLRLGGFIGRGTGDQSTGRRYVDNERSANDATESGWGSMAIEWGVIGLAAWIVWAAMWIRRSLRKLRDDDGSPAAPMRGFVAYHSIVLLTVLFSLGSGFFENYIANAYFWFLSGIAFASPIATANVNAVPSGPSDRARPTPLLRQT